MNVLEIDFKNCYGIGSLEKEFRFTDRDSVHVIYAANGVMKSSFTKTFFQWKEGKDPVDRVHKDLASTSNILLDGKPLDKDHICVIEPYAEYYKSEDVSRLVANKVIRERYEMAVKNLNNAKVNFINTLSECSGIKTLAEIERRVKEDIGIHAKSERVFFDALARVKGELDEDLKKYSCLKYNSIFEEKVEKILEKEDFKKGINSYVEKYNALLGKSNFFKRGDFTPINAEKIATELDSNGYFEAEHKLTLSGDSKTITSKKDMIDFIAAEKEAIIQDKELVKLYNKIQKMLSGNKELRQFEKYLSDNPIIVEKLQNTSDFKQILWKSYFYANRKQYDDILEEFEHALKEINAATSQADAGRVKWEEVVETFNKRFKIPVKISITNKAETIFGKQTPNFEFEYEDDSHGNEIMLHENIVSILSQGEKKALYMLNVIYDIIVRQESGQPTLYIVDDIADSFDYKNKYAIVQYLNELGNTSTARQIILSHNFDFYRTICGRLGVQHSNRWHAIKGKKRKILLLKQERHHDNPMKSWIKSFCSGETIANSDMGQIIALVPLVREINSLTGGKGEIISKTLNKALHDKDGSENLTLGCIVSSISTCLGINQTHCDTMLWMKAVEDTAISIANSSNADSMELEHKVTLSIAIRLEAEKFMISRLSADGESKTDLCARLKKKLKEGNTKGSYHFQTRLLIDAFNQVFSENADDQEISNELEIIDEVGIMTPEAIHLNSFMYEPLIDMSGWHLCDLYKKVKALNDSHGGESKA